VDRSSCVTSNRRHATWQLLAGTLALLLLAAGAAASAASASLVGQWRFDEPDGQVVSDDGPFALDGWLGAAAGADGADPLRIAGLSGSALRFDGTSLVRLPSSPALAPQRLTVEAVVRAPTSPGSWRHIVSRGGNGCIAAAYGLYTAAADGLAIYIFDGSRFLVSATARPEDVWDGGWHHVAGTFDGAALRLYIDGRPVGEPMPAPLRIDYGGTSTATQIGQYGGACDRAFVGDVDQVTLWSHALSAQELEDAQPDGPATPLPAAAAGTIIAGEGGLTAPAASTAPSGCKVRVSRKRVAAGRRVVVRARVTRLGRGHRSARVVARRAGRRKTLASASISARGHARLVLRLRRGTKVELRVKGRAGCAPAYVRVTR
jgi:hypothetical protein